MKASDLRVGDLVRCVWQPSTSRYVDGVGCIPMERTIKGEFGIIVKHEGHRYDIMFSQLDGYTHWLSHSAFEVINECR